jgi:DNA-binding CsgD family transcriptional regulator
MSPNGTGLWAGELDGLVGRDAVLAALRDLLHERGRTVVVTGLAGAGKTSVLAVAARALSAEGRLVLPASGYESDRDLAFGVLVDLLSSAPDAERVLGQVLADPDRATAIDPLLLRLDVLAWLQRLSATRPVVLLADDLQWWDDSTLSVLGFVSNRLRGSNISLLAATRDDVPPPPLRHCAQVPLPPLTDVEARVLLRRAGLATRAPWVLERAAGNPLALLELGRAAAGTREGVPPSSVETSFREQVAELPGAARWALLLAAAGDGNLTVLGRTMDPARLVDALAPAEAAGLATIAGRAVRFRHPLVAAAVYALASTTDRLAAHAALSAAYADDPARAAWHRAEATVAADEEVAAALVAASELAARRGASAEAARLLARAAELSPDRTDREQRLLGAVQTSVNAGNFEWVIETGGRLQLEAGDPSIQILAAQATAYALAQTQRSGAARRALVRVLEKLVDVDPLSGWSSLTTLAALTYRCGWDRAEVARWLAAYDAATSAAGPDSFPAMVPAARAWVRMQIDPLSNPEDVLDLVRHAPVPAYPGFLRGSHEMLLGAAAWLLDEPATALERLGRALDIMRDADTPGEMVQTVIALALVQLQTGDYEGADEASRLIIDMSESRNQYNALSDGYDLQARVAGLRGDTSRARDLCGRILQELPVGEALAVELSVGITMSWVLLAENDVGAAWTEVRPLFDDDGEPAHPHLSYQQLGHYAASAARAGELEQLARVVEVADQRLRRPRPYHRLQLARARALLTGDDAERWHAAAVAEQRAADWPFELANARLEYGAWLRRRHRPTEARAQLQPALDVFDRLGTRAWAELARAELRATGVATQEPEPSAWSHLTAQEREVVRLAALGRTNPEIAAALYLSPRTVSTHLYNAFPKLGVTSRAQLRDVVPDAT